MTEQTLDRTFVRRERALRLAIDATVPVVVSMNPAARRNVKLDEMILTHAEVFEKWLMR